MDAPTGIRGFIDDVGGALLVASPGGLRRFAEGRFEPYPIPGVRGRFRAQHILRDRDGALWIGTYGDGLVHVHQGRTDVLTRLGGLSGDRVHDLFEDREGNVWVLTDSGLDRFRDLAVATYADNNRLSSIDGGPVLVANDGALWFQSPEGVSRWKDERLIVYGKRDASTVNGRLAREVTGTGLPRGLGNLFQDDRGRIWIASLTGFGYLDRDKYTVVHRFSDGVGGAIVGDGRGGLWLSAQIGLFQVTAQDAVTRIPWEALGNRGPAFALAPDPERGGLWLGFFTGGVAYFEDGQIRVTYGVPDGLGAGRISDFRRARDGTLWAATEGGLSRFRNGRFATLSSANGLPCDAVQWAIEDDADSFWLNMPCGLVRVPGADIRAWAARVDEGAGTGLALHTTLLDTSQGVRNQASATAMSPKVAKTPDGRLWFVTIDGLSVLDPRHIPFNSVPPPVHVEQVIANRQAYDLTVGTPVLKLPALIHDLEIDYTALSTGAPEKAQFRYKLERFDRDWQNAGTRRQAFYNNLPPGDYRFRVSASNDSGVWNEAGAFIDLSIAPAYYQTSWFRLLVAAAVVAMLVAFHQRRLRRVAWQFSMRVEERVNERTRIARDLHDTLLQSFQAVLLRFHAATLLLPGRPDEAQKTLAGVIEQAEQAITEGRDAVKGLRASATGTTDLASVIGALGEELSADVAGPLRPDVTVNVEGTPRPLVPLVHDDIYRVAGEALRNAFRHAHAHRIEVEIRYIERQLRLRIRDDGRGMDGMAFDRGQRTGHYGLAGMRERAELVGGELAIWSELDSGTEIELTVPGSIAYAKSSGANAPVVLDVPIRAFATRKRGS